MEPIDSPESTESTESSSEDWSIGVTVVPDIPSIQDEWLFASLDALPFNVSIPTGWTVVETDPEYLIHTKDGLNGGLTLNKKAQESSSADLGEVLVQKDNFAIYCQAERDGRQFCYAAVGEETVGNAAVGEEIYLILLTNKSLSSEEHEWLEAILLTARLDE